MQKEIEKMEHLLRITIVVLIALSFSSCATTAKYSAKIQTWMGHDVNELN